MRGNVTEKTAENCFKCTGFKNECRKEKEINKRERVKASKKEVKETVDTINEVLDINSNEGCAIESGLNISISFKQFL